MRSPTTATSAVPLPKRAQAGSSQHHIALLIREGRRAAQQLAAATVDPDRDGDDWLAKETSRSSGVEMSTSVSTVLEKDFTVQGKKGALACPFSARQSQDGGIPNGAERVDGSQDPAGVTADPTPHKSSDPICAALLEDAAPTGSAPSKCPIRFLDRHSPEEIARYVEKHKHELPRSHEVCVRRYQRNEEQIRKLDAKYGNLVNMVKDLSHLHRPMLPPTEDDQKEIDRASNKRVEDWARTVVAADPEEQEEPPVKDERESRFDRPLREVRVGESPSRPWGISVPAAADPVPEREPSPSRPVQDTLHATRREAGPARKCPFDHTKMGFQEGHGKEARQGADAHGKPPVAPAKDKPPSSTPQPTFVNLPETTQPAEKGERPQIVFNISGPVFIGYPMEQAIEFMQRFQGFQGR